MTMQDIPRLLEADIKNAQAIEVDGYTYRLYSVGENGIALQARLIRDVADHLYDLGGELLSAADGIMAVAPGGTPWAMILSYLSNWPVVVLRTHLTSIGAKGVIEWDLDKILSSEKVVGTIHPGGRVIIIDDVISSGDTALEMINSIRTHGYSVSGFLSILATPDGLSLVQEKCGVTTRSIAIVE